MKKVWLFFIVIILVFSIITCSGDTEDEVTNEDEDITVEEPEEIPTEEAPETPEVTEEEVVEEIIEEEEEVVEVKEPLYEMTSTFSVKPIEGTDAPENVVLLTIDDSFLDNNNVYALEMAQILYDLDARAIFFVNGQVLDTEENRAKLKEIYDMGFEIGNHTMNHPDLSAISSEEQREQIAQLNDLIEEITGERPRFFRAPYGKNTDTSRTIMEEEGMQWMNWSYGYDWVREYMEADALAKIMVEPDPPGLLRNGANLLIHDRPFTKDALKDIVEGIRGKGFEFVDPALIK